MSTVWSPRPSSLCLRSELQLGLLGKPGEAAVEGAVRQVCINFAGDSRFGVHLTTNIREGGSRAKIPPCLGMLQMLGLSHCRPRPHNDRQARSSRWQQIYALGTDVKPSI